MKTIRRPRIPSIKDIPFYDDFGMYEDNGEVHYREPMDPVLLVLTISVIFLLFTIMLFVYQNSRIEMLETDIQTLRGFIRDLQ